MNVIYVNNPKGLHRSVEIGPPVADLILVDYMQPLPQQTLPQEQEWISATLTKAVHPYLWKLLIIVLG